MGKVNDKYWGKLLYYAVQLQMSYPITIGRAIFCSLMSLDPELSEELRDTEYDTSSEDNIDSIKIKNLKKFLDKKYLENKS